MDKVGLIVLRSNVKLWWMMLCDVEDINGKDMTEYESYYDKTRDR